MTASIFSPLGIIAPPGVNTGVSGGDLTGPLQSGGLVFIPAGNPGTGHNGLMPIFTVGSGVNFDVSTSSP